MLVYPGTTVREFCKMLSGEMDKHFLYAEGVTGQRVICINLLRCLLIIWMQMGEDEELTKDNNIVKFVTAAAETSNVTHKETKQQDTKGKATTKKNKEDDDN